MDVIRSFRTSPTPNIKKKKTRDLLHQGSGAQIVYIYPPTPRLLLSTTFSKRRRGEQGIITLPITTFATSMIALLNGWPCHDIIY